MSFLEQQYLNFENVLSYRTRVDINRLDAILKFAEENIDALGLRVTGNTLFTVSETVKDKNKCILGVEILIPLDKAFESNEQYVYKPEFRLVNAVSAIDGTDGTEITVTGVPVICEEIIPEISRALLIVQQGLTGLKAKP